MDATPNRASRIPRPSSQKRASQIGDRGLSTMSSGMDGNENVAEDPNVTVSTVRQLKEDIKQLKRQIDVDAAHAKRLKREKIKDIQKVREEEQEKSKNLLADLRYRLNQEKEREVENLKAQLSKQHSAEISKILKEKDAFTKANKEASRERTAFIQRLQDEAKTAAREEAKLSFSAEKYRLIQEIEELKKTKRQVEEELARERSAGRGSSEGLRRLTEEHQREMEQLKKEARKDIIILIDEIKAKDRVISELEKDLGHQTGYAQRLSMERSSTLDQLNLTKLRDTWERNSSSQKSSNSKKNVSGTETSTHSTTSVEDSHKSLKDSTAISEEEAVAAAIKEKKIKDNSLSTQTLPKVDQQSHRPAKKSLLSRKSPLPRQESPVPSDDSRRERSLPKLGPPSRSSTPTRQVTDSLQKRLQESETNRKRLERKCKMLEDELTKVMKDQGKTKRPQSPWTTEKMDQLTKSKSSKKPRDARKRIKEEKGMEEELGRIRRQMDEQFEEIVELKQAAMADKKRQLFGARRNSLPSETQSEVGASLNSSLAISEADDIHVLGRPSSRSDYESRESLSLLTASDSKWDLTDDDVKELKAQLMEMESSQEKLLSELHESKEMNELLEFQLLEAAETDHKGLPLTTELLREILEYMQAHEGKNIDVSELKQKVDEVSCEKTDSGSQEVVENLKSILDFFAVEIANLTEQESELQGLIDEKMEEVETLAAELTQLMPKLEEKDEIIKVAHKKLDDLLENEFDLLEKVKDYETQVAVLSEELLEFREKSAKATDSGVKASTTEVTSRSDGEENKRREEKAVQVCTLTRRKRRSTDKKGDMSGDEDIEDSDISFGDDDSISGLLPDEDGAGDYQNVGDAEIAHKLKVLPDGASIVQDRNAAAVDMEGGDWEGKQRVLEEKVSVLEGENRRLVSEKSEMESEETKLKDMIQTLEDKYVSREKELQTIIEDLRKEERQLIDQLQQRDEDVSKQAAMLESEREIMEKHLQDSESERKLLRDALETEKNGRMCSQGSEGDEYMEGILVEIGKLESDLKVLQEKQDVAQGLVDGLESEGQSLKEVIASLMDEKKEIEEALDKLSNQRKEVEEDLKKKENELERIVEKKDELMAKQDQAMKDLSKEMELLKERRGEDTQSFEKEIQRRQDEMEKMKNEILDLQEKLQTSESKLKNDHKARENEMDELKEATSLLDEEVEVTKEHVLDVETDMSDKSEAGDIDKDELECAMKNLTILQNKLKTQEEENVILRTEMKSLEHVNDEYGIILLAKQSLEASIDQLNIKNASLEERVILQEQEILHRQKEEEESRSRMEVKDNRIQELEDMLAKSQESNQEAEELNQEIAKLELCLAQERSNSNGEIETLKKTIQCLKDSNMELKANFEKAETEISELNLHLANVAETSSGKILNLEAKLKDITWSSGELEKSKEALEKEFSSLKELLNSAREENGKLAQEIELLKLPSEDGHVKSLEEVQTEENNGLAGENEQGWDLQSGLEDGAVARLTNELERVKGLELQLSEENRQKASDLKALGEEVEKLKHKNHLLEENESKLVCDLMDKDAKLQQLRAKELELEEKVKNLLISGAGFDQPSPDWTGMSSDELESRKAKIGELEDELERMKQEGEYMFGGGETDNEYDMRCSGDGVIHQVSQGHHTDGLDESSNFYSVVEQEVWEEVQISVKKPVAMARPPSLEKAEVSEDRGLLNQRIELLEAEVRSQKDLLEEETLAKEKLQEEIWGMLQTEKDLRDQLSTLQEQNEGLQSNFDFLKELEVEIESLKALVEKLSQEKKQLEKQAKDAELSRNEHQMKLEDKVKEFEKIKVEVNAMEDERERLMEQVRDMEANMQVIADGLATGGSLDLLQTGESSDKMDGGIKLDEGKSPQESQLDNKTRISLDTSEMDSLLFSSDDESDLNGKSEESLEEKVKRLEKLNQALKVQVKHLLTFQEIGAALSEGQTQGADDRNIDRKSSIDSVGQNMTSLEVAESLSNDLASENDLKKQLALSEENNRYLEQQLEDLRQLMQDGGFENQDVLIEKVEILEKSQRHLLEEIEKLKMDLTEKEDELRNTQSELLNTEAKFSDRVNELERSEQRLVEKLEANNEEWRMQAESSMERIDQLENVRNELRKQLSEAEEQVQEMQASHSFGNLSGTHQSGLSLLDEGLGALDIGRNSFDEFDGDVEDEDNGLQREMEDVIRGIDKEEESGERKEEKEFLLKRIQELEKSETELMEKVDILTDNEMEVSALCENLSKEVEEKTSKLMEMEREIGQMREEDRTSEEELKIKVDTLKEEIIHLQEQISFTEEERDSLLQKVEELSNVRGEEPGHEQSPDVVHISDQNSENRIEINVLQWQANSVDEVQQIEKPIRVRNVARYDNALPYLKLCFDGDDDVENEDQELAGQRFFETFHSETSSMKPVHRHFEENIQEEGTSEDENGPDIPGIGGGPYFGEGELNMAMHRSLVAQSSQVVMNNFEGRVFHPSFHDDVYNLSNSSSDSEEGKMERCEEPLFCKEELVPVQMHPDLFAFQDPERISNTDGTVDADIDLTPANNSVTALQNRIKELESKDRKWMEKVLQLEENQEQLDDRRDVVVEPSIREEEEKMKNRIRELEKNEEALNVRIEELEVMQSAFEETLGQADAIMKEREAEYLQKIETLEKEQTLWRNFEGKNEEDGDAETVEEHNLPGVSKLVVKDGQNATQGELLFEEEFEKIIIKRDSQIAELEEILRAETQAKEERSSKLEKLEEDIEQLEGDLKERDRVNEELKLRLEEQLKSVEEKEALKERISDLEESVTEKSERISGLESEISDLLREIKTKNDEDSSVKESVSASLETDDESCVNERIIAQIEGSQNKPEVQGSKERIEELEMSEIKLISELEEALETGETLKQENERLEGLLRDLEKGREKETLEKLEDGISSLHDKIAALEEERSAVMAQLEEKDEVVKDFMENEKILEEENNALNDELENLHRRDEERKEMLMKQENDLREKSKLLEEQVRTITSLETDLEKYAIKLESEEERVKKAVKTSEILREEKEKVCEDLRKQQVENSSLEKKLSEIANKSVKKDKNPTDDDVHQEDEMEEKDFQVKDEADLELQEELHLANIHIEDLKRSKIALEEQLKKVRQSLRSNNMVTLPEEEYQQLRARAQSVDSSVDAGNLLDSSNDVEQFANAGKLWVKLDQTTKELRKYQELYNTTIKEVGHLKQALREVSDKHEAYLQGRRGSVLIETVALPTTSAGAASSSCDHKFVQTKPLKVLPSDALKMPLAAGSQPVTLQELLEAIPESTESSRLSDVNHSPNPPSLVAAGDDVFLLHSPSPIKVNPSSSDVLSESFLNTSMWPPDLGVQEKQNAWDEIQSALALEEFSDAPPLPNSLPPRASSNLSIPESPEFPPLPNHPPPTELSSANHEGSLPADKFDPQDSEPENEVSQSQEQVDGFTAQPHLVTPKPATADWLKEMKMEEWAKLMDETEEMKNKVIQLEEQIEAKDEQLNNLHQERDDLSLKAREGEDGVLYREKLREKEAELEEKEQQIRRLKGEMKKKDGESIPLKLQLESLKDKHIKLLQENGQTLQLRDKMERLQDNLKDKEQNLRLIEAEQVRLKQTLAEKEKSLFLKEREVKELEEKLKQQPNFEDVSKEESENWKSDKEYLQEQNERLKRQVDQLEPLKERMMNLQSQLEIGLSSNQDKNSLVKKLELAEKLLQEKTEQELRLLQDNGCLQRRIDKLERERSFQEGLEAEYENMKEQFDELENKKHEAELSVAPLKAKVSYLLKQFQEKDGILRRMAAEAAVRNPERASEIFEEIESLKDQLPSYEASEDKTILPHQRRSRSKGTRAKGDPSRVDLDNLKDEEVTLQDLLNESSRPTTGKFLPIVGSGEDLSPLVYKRGEAREKVKTIGESSPSVSSNDTLKMLLQLDGEDGVDLPVNRLNSELGADNQNGMPVSSYVRPPLRRMKKNDFGSTDPPSSLSSSVDIPTSFPLPVHLAGVDLQEGRISGIANPSGPGSTAMVNGHSNILFPDSEHVSGNVMPHSYPQTVAITQAQAMSNASVDDPTIHGLRNGPLAFQSMTQLRVPPMYNCNSLSSSLPSSHIQPSSRDPCTPPVTTGTMAPAPPQSLKVARRVSKTSVLLVWKPPPLDQMTRSNGHEIAGYKIYVNGHLNQLVSSPHLTKALLTNLDLKTVQTFGIQTVSVHDRGSAVRQVNFSLLQTNMSLISDSSLSDSAKEPSSEASSSIARVERPKQRMFMAVYSYNPLEHSPNDNPEKELNFKEGELIKVEGNMREDGFYHGSIEGKKGLVPSNFVEEVNISSKAGKNKKLRDGTRQPGGKEARTKRSKPSILYSKSNGSKV